jgi:hypothetical protein
MLVAHNAIRDKQTNFLVKRAKAFFYILWGFISLSVFRTWSGYIGPYHTSHARI